MTAEGKRTVVRLQPGDRFLITDDQYGRALTGAPVGPDTDWQICTRLRSNYAATVVRLDPATGQGSRIRWDIVTDHGTVKAQISGQTVTLAREHHTPAPFVAAAVPPVESGPAYDVVAIGADGAAVVVASVRHIDAADDRVPYTLGSYGTVSGEDGNGHPLTRAGMITEALPVDGRPGAYRVRVAQGDEWGQVVYTSEPAGPYTVPTAGVRYDIRPRNHGPGGFELIEISPAGPETWISSSFTRSKLEMMRDRRTAAAAESEPLYVVTFSPQPLSGPGSIVGLRRMVLAEAQSIVSVASRIPKCGRIVNAATLEVVEIPAPVRAPEPPPAVQPTPAAEPVTASPWGELTLTPDGE